MAWCVVHGHLDGAADLICVAMHGRGAAFTLPGDRDPRSAAHCATSREHTYHSPTFAEYSASVTCSIQFE